MRYALVTGATAKAVRAYMPSNYAAAPAGRFAPYDDKVLITGEDNAGWTLDGYVIPRLASGLIFAREITAEERELLLDDARINDWMTADELRGISAPDF